MNVAIIGCGYVGSAVGKALVEAGYDVVGTTTRDTRTSELEALGIHPAVLRVGQVDSLQKVVADRDVVYLTVAAGRQHADYRSVYVEGVANLIEACRDSKVRHIIYTSSTSVYGQIDGGWVDEESPTEPMSESGKLLLEAERRLFEGAIELGGADASVEGHPTKNGAPSKTIATVVRLAGVYGPNRNPADWFAHSSTKERTDGDAYLNLIHLDDIVTALIAILRTPYPGLLNLADDGAIPRRDFYNRLAAELSLAPPIWIAPDGEPNRGRRVRNDRIKRILGLELKHPIH